jgi:uncharacterized membrane protein
MAFCATCGSSVEGPFCAKCGTPVAAGAAPGAGAGPAPGYGTTPGYGATAGTATAANAGMAENVAGALCYVLGLLTGILFLVLAPYNQNPRIKFHAFQSIFFHLAMIACWIALLIISVPLHILPVIGSLIAILLWFALGVGAFIVWVYLLYKTYNNELVILPVVGPLAQKQANS